MKRDQVIFVCVLASCMMQYETGFTTSRVAFVQAPLPILELPDTMVYLPLQIQGLPNTSVQSTYVHVDSTLAAICQAHNVLSVVHAFTQDSSAITADAALMELNRSFLADWFRVELPDTADVDAFVAVVNNSGLGYAEPQYHVAFDNGRVPNDTLWRLQGYMARDTNVWLIDTGSVLTKVAILDGWVEHRHPDFLGRAFYGPGPGGVNGHGTCVASIIGARTNNNGLLMAAKNWACQLGDYPIPDGSDQQWIADKMRDAVAAGSQILNCSFHIINSLENPVFSAIVQQAAAEVTQAGSVIIAAAGNNYPTAYGWESDAPHYSGSYNGLAICVGGYNFPDSVRSNCCFGVDFASQGSHVVALTAFNPPIDMNFAGTSAATALTSGDASLLMGYAARQGYPALDYDDVLNLLKLGTPRWASGYRTEDPTYGWGGVMLEGPSTLPGTFVLLRHPNVLERFTTSFAGATETTSPDTVKMNVPNLAYDQYSVTRHELIKTVVYPEPFYQVHDVWTNGRLSNGAQYASYALGDYAGGTVTSNQSAEALSYTNSSCVVRTCWYEIPGHGSWPATQGTAASAAITVAGELLLPPTDVSVNYDTALGLVTITSAAIYPRTADRYEFSVQPDQSGPWIWFQTVDSGVMVARVNYNNLTGSEYYAFGVRPRNVHQWPIFGSLGYIQARPNRPEDVIAGVVVWGYSPAGVAMMSSPDQVGTAAPDPGAPIYTTSVHVSWSPPLNQFRPPHHYSVEAWDSTYHLGGFPPHDVKNVNVFDNLNGSSATI